MKFDVEVERRSYQLGVVKVACDTEDSALEMVNELLDSNALKMEDVYWNEPTHEQGSFETSGGVWPSPATTRDGACEPA